MKIARHNINYNVWVKLTPEGKKQYRKYYRDLFRNISSFIEVKKLPAPDNGWYKFQMWELMEVFGPALYMGCRVPFETEIRIEVEDESNT